jgi:hypothetical protein
MDNIQKLLFGGAGVLLLLAYFKNKANATDIADTALEDTSMGGGGGFGGGGGYIPMPSDNIPPVETIVVNAQTGTVEQLYNPNVKGARLPNRINVQIKNQELVPPIEQKNNPPIENSSEALPPKKIDAVNQTTQSSTTNTETPTPPPAETGESLSPSSSGAQLTTSFLGKNEFNQNNFFKIKKGFN